MADVLEIWPEYCRLRRHGNRDAEAETARETENPGAWGGESGRGPARGEGKPGCRWGGVPEIQVFSFPESGRPGLDP
jgi:hypothetical protein